MIGADQTLILEKYIKNNNISTIGFSPVNSLLIDFGFNACDYKKYIQEFTFQRGNPYVPKLYWFAVRESWTNKQRILKVLSRRMATKQLALNWAEYEESLVKRKNSNHKYFAIQMES